jgi:hypothetical protein
MKHPSNNTAQTAQFPHRQFSAQVNGKRFVATHVTGLSCLRAELVGARKQKIWKINAVGQVGKRRTMFGLFIAQTLQPGLHSLVRNDEVSAVYHVTPRQFLQVYHSRDFQSGSVTLLECNAKTGRLRGTFEFGMSAIDFSVLDGEFDLVCQREELPERSA